MRTFWILALSRHDRGMPHTDCSSLLCVCDKAPCKFEASYFFCPLFGMYPITHDTRPPTVLSWASVYLPQCACDAQPCKFEHLIFKKQTVYSTIIMCKPAYVVHIHLTRASPNKCSNLTSFEKPEVVANKILKNLVYKSF